jgi:lysyl-tRNA synthetase class 1
VISIADMLEVVPPDVLRYLIFRTRPRKSIVFDPGLPLLNLVDELDDADNKNRDTRAHELSMVTGMEPVGIPFKHLVNIFQIARGDAATTLEIIKRGGYSVRDEKALFRRMEYARTWLTRHAPEEMRFTPLEELPAEAASFSPGIKKAFAFFAEALTPDMSGDAVHELFYQVKDASGVDPKDFFRAVYLLLIGKERGPRAGWFIQILGIPAVKERFAKAAAL